MNLLDLKNLSVLFGSEDRPFTAVDKMELTVAEGEVVGIVGESGSGKSVTSLAIMGLIDFPGRVMADRAYISELGERGRYNIPNHEGCGAGAVDLRVGAALPRLLRCGALRGGRNPAYD